MVYTLSCWERKDGIPIGNEKESTLDLSGAFDSRFTFSVDDLSLENVLEVQL